MMTKFARLLMLLALVTGIMAHDPGWIAPLVRLLPEDWRTAFWRNGDVVEGVLTVLVIGFAMAAAAMSTVRDGSR